MIIIRALNLRQALVFLGQVCELTGFSQASDQVNGEIPLSLFSQTWPFADRERGCLARCVAANKEQHTLGVSRCVESSESLLLWLPRASVCPGAHSVRDGKMAPCTGGETEAQRVTPSVFRLLRALSSLPLECLVLAVYPAHSDLPATILLRPPPPPPSETLPTLPHPPVRAPTERSTRPR